MRTRAWRTAISFAGIGAASFAWMQGCGSTTSEVDAGSGAGTAGVGGAGGGGNASGAGGAGNASGSGGVVLCTSDKACVASSRLCDPNRLICVECRADSDCGASSTCVDGACQAFAACTDSRDCPVDRVCDDTVGRCVQCLTNGDCGTGAICSSAICRTTCNSDKECVGSNQLCDEVHGYCTDCVKDADCGSNAHCHADTCITNVCKPLSTVCLGSDLFTCAADGTGYSSQTCSNGCNGTGVAQCAGEGGAGGMPGTAGAGGATATGGSGGTGGGSGGTTGGAGGSGGSGACASEVVTVPNCCTLGATTKNRYSGIVTITVSGILYNAPAGPEDPFYTPNSSDTSLQLAVCPACVLYNYASEGTCVCAGTCAGGHTLSGILTGAYPPFSASHSYTVTANLGSGSPQQLVFSNGDGGCADNSGTWTLTISATASGTCLP